MICFLDSLYSQILSFCEQLGSIILCICMLGFAAIILVIHNYGKVKVSISIP